MICEDPISCYSKGARGLSVQSRVSGIFTATAISPSPLLRQRPSRYTIRAGRNLPDKEFRSSSSPCRHEARTISSTRCRNEMVGVWPLRIPKAKLISLSYSHDFKLLDSRPFLLIVRTGCIFTVSSSTGFSPDFPAYSRILQRP